MHAFLDVFLLMMCSGAFLVTEGAIKLETTPKEIDLYNTKSFTVNCTYKPEANVVNPEVILSLVLSKTSPTGVREAKELASIDSKSLVNVLDSNIISPNVKLSGKASEKDISYLSGTWGQISDDLVGTYACEANVIDKVGHIKSFSTEQHVLEESNSLRTFLEEVKAMRKDLDSHQACCTNMSAQVAEIQTWRKSVALSLAVLEKTLLVTRPSQVHQNSTYYVSNYTISGVNTAEAVCETLGGYLAEVDDDEEFRFVKSVMENSTLTTAFISGRDDIIDGQWYLPRTQQALPFTQWAPAQPIDLYTKNNIEDCIEILKAYQWKMNDVPCSDIHRSGFICEVPVNF